MNNLLYDLLSKRLLMLLCLFSLLLSAASVKGQEKPPKPIIVTVNIARQLQFGSFIQAGDYGTVTVDHTGARTASGSVILPNISSSAPSSAALFIVEAHPGTLITILNGLPVELTGSNGGKMTLTLGNASVSSPFITRGRFTDVFIGGSLEVKTLSANPAGSYSGTFQVTFIQE